MAVVHKKKLGFKIKNWEFIKKIILIVFLAIIIFNVSSTVWNLKAKYFSANYRQSFPSLEKTFLDSQYVNKHPTGWIPDEIAFSYAGGKLIQGTSPVLVVPDAPPLGKYIIGLSTVMFNNDSIFMPVFAILSLVLLYLLSFQIFSSKILSLIPPLFLSFEPIFKNQLIYVPLLDLFQLAFLLASFYVFNKGLTGRKKLLFFSLSSIFLGFFIATKFFITGFVIIAAYLLVTLYNKDKESLIKLSFTFPIALFILLLSYARVFAFGYSFSKFLGIQKWVFLYHKSFLILPFSVWPLILFNKWYVWYGDKPVISDTQWSITWPVLTVLSIVTIVLYILRKIPKKKELEVLMSWVLCYMLFLSLGESYSRYFVILIPILYIICVYGLYNVGIKLFKHVNKN